MMNGHTSNEGAHECGLPELFAAISKSNGLALWRGDLDALVTEVHIGDEVFPDPDCLQAGACRYCKALTT